MINLLLTISDRSVLTAAQFLGLNAITVVMLCSLYSVYLYFLYRKRIRLGRYEIFPAEK